MAGALSRLAVSGQGSAESKCGINRSAPSHEMVIMRRPGLSSCDKASRDLDPADLCPEVTIGLSLGF
jgi:hypothetical protein